MKIHIFGASGSGTTTLGRFLANDLKFPHFDSDDYYWQKTDPPYVEKKSVSERQASLLADMRGHTRWVLSGSMDSWSEPFVPLFDLAVFLKLSPEIRLQRLRMREKRRHGDRILPGGDMFQAHVEFLLWAEQYDTGTPFGRNLKRHEDWIESLPCPVLRIESEISIEDAARRVIQQLGFDLS